MSKYGSPTDAQPNSAPSLAQFALLGAIFSVSLVVALLLVRLGDFSLGLLATLPLTALGFTLVLWNTHWALCFVAFAITPFGVVQQELIGVTLNLPEVLILALVAKEGLRFFVRNEFVSHDLPWKALTCFALGLTVALATGLIRGNGAAKALQDFRQFGEFAVLFLLIVQRVRTPESVVQLCISYVLGATVIAIHGIIQHFVPVGISQTQIASDLVLHHGVRSGSFYGATPLGGMMVLAVGPAIGSLIMVKKRPAQALLAICIGLCLLAMIFTKTRGSWVGMAVSLAFFFSWVRPSRKMALWSVATAVVLALFAGPTVVSRLGTLSNPEEDASLMERALYYAAATHIGRAHPILGLGWGCYYSVDEIAKAEKYVDTPRPEGAEDATVHSAYLQILVKTGALGLLGFLAVIVVWVERIWRVYTARPHESSQLALFAGVTAALTGYLFHSTFENFFQWPVMAQSFWLLLGLSFVMAGTLGVKERFILVPMTAVGTCVVLFAVFMGFCMRLETAHADHYEKNVAKALAAGDLDKALRVARRAVKMRDDDPKPHVAYASALLMNGDQDEAITQLELATGVVLSEFGPRKVGTGTAYYFAPARLMLGQLQAESGEFLHGITQFELAGVYADLGDPAYGEYHDTLYQSYAEVGLWTRALEFGTPNSAEWEELNARDLAELAHAYHATLSWEPLQAVAERLLEHTEFQDDAHFLLGRAQLSLDQTAKASDHFAAAAAGNHPDANYYLGRCLETMGRHPDAIRTLMETPETSAFRPIALAHALALCSSQDASASEASQISNLLHAALADMENVRDSDETIAVPDAYSISAMPRRHDGTHPLLLRWGTAPESSPIVSGVTVLDESLHRPAYRLGKGGPVLQLQWSKNRLLDPMLFQTRDQPGPFPGWIDEYKDWYELRSNYTATATFDAGMANFDIPGPALFSATPIQIRESGSFLLTAAARKPAATALRLGWQVLGEEEEILLDQTLLATPEHDELSSGAAFISPDSATDAIRVQIEIGRGSEPMRFSNLALFELKHPRPDLAASSSEDSVE
jgi:tetratricopeptide (TPR) repeat protein